MARTITVATNDIPLSAIIVIKNTDMIGVESEFRGSVSLRNCRKTASERRTVIISDNRSPLAGGNQKLNRTIDTRTIQGAITLKT